MHFTLNFTINRSIQKIIHFNFVVIFLVVSSGCSKSSPTNDTAATTNVTPTNTTTDGTTRALAWCNQGLGSNYSLNLQAFIDTNNSVLGDWVLAKITKANTAFNTGGSFIQFYRWKALTDGTTSLDTNPLVFQLQDLTTKASVIAGSTALNWSDVSAKAGNMIPQDYFNTVRFVIHTLDSTLEYQALKMVIYDSNNQVVDQVDLLLPVFEADPTKYATTPSGGTRPQVLQNLHPLTGLSGDSLNISQMQNMVDQYCF